MKPIMSVKEARKLLDKEYASMTDEEVAELVENTYKLAKLALDIAGEQRQKTLVKVAPKNLPFHRRSV